MKRIKRKICTAVMIASFVLSACGVHAEETCSGDSLTVEEVVECTMESLKVLDLEQFNMYTDNYVKTHYNWLGIPVRSQYRVFNELLQPGIKIGKWKKKYEFDYKLDKKMMENLAWEIEEIRVDGDNAKIAMTVINLNMSDIMGEYELSILENMIAGEGTGIRQMIKDLSNLANEEDGLLTLIESHDKRDLSMLKVIVTAYRRDGAWVVHLDDDFINAFLGNINAEEYSEEIQKDCARNIDLQNRDNLL